MNNLEKKELKDYTDDELMSEIAKRISNFSLEISFSAYPLVIIATQYIRWYEEEKEKLQKKPAPE